MSKTEKNILTVVDTILAKDELQDQPRAFLLLRLCQLSLVFLPEKTEYYWNQLKPLKKKLPEEYQADFQNLHFIMEVTSVSHVKRFTAEVIADIEEAKNVFFSNAEEAKQRLHDCELRLKKRLWPFGKSRAWIALINAWANIDRRYAFQLINKISGNAREDFIKRMNQENPLLPEEWDIVAKKVGVKNTVAIIIKLLDANHTLCLSNDILAEVGKRILTQLQLLTTDSLREELFESVKRYEKLVKMHINLDIGKRELIAKMMNEFYTFVVGDDILNQIWYYRFTVTAIILRILVDFGLLTEAGLEDLIKKTPSYLTDFVRAHYAALMASADNFGQVYTDLMSKTNQNTYAEAWFLVTLVRRGLHKEAMTIATRSDRASELLSRVKRAWLCEDPESFRLSISVQEMEGDPVGLFLTLKTVQDRVTYLKKATDNGTRSLPGPLWVYVKEPEEKPKGFWKKLKSLALEKTHNEKINEFLTHNPMYAVSTYFGNTERDKQFAEYLRVMGYGEYHYQNIDEALLETLVAWDDENHLEVQSLLNAMWNSIQPDDDILMEDWLRNVILERCRSVFSVSPEMLINDFLEWFKQELVDKGRTWIAGNREITLIYPDTAPFSFCVSSAAKINKFSPSRRDRILLLGLQKFKSDSPLVEAAAQLYNSDKQLLDLTLPIDLRPELIQAWQLGIVKNAIPSIVGEMRTKFILKKITENSLS